MDWNDVRHFLALARQGSARAAGAELGVSHSTVVRRIEALEEQLAARLFDRTRDGYSLTPAGRELMPGAERVEREMAAMERGVVGRDGLLAGPVNLTCSDEFIADIVLGELIDFLADHPEIELRVTADARPFDLSKREADIALRILRLGDLPPAHLIGRRLAPLVMGSYVARAHADRLDPTRPDTRWVGFAEPDIQRTVVATSSYPDLPLWGGFASIALMVSAARHGLGVVMLPTYVGDRQPQLQRLPRPDLRHMADLWLLSHPDLRTNARFRATRERIADAIEHHAPLFRGQRWSTAAPVGSEIAPDADGDGLV